MPHPSLPRRHSIRLQGYDYTSPGAYFVTIVTYGRALLFGKVVGGEMRLSTRGEVADACWRLIPSHFPRVELGAFVVMPNHVHGILVFHDPKLDERRGVRSYARAHHGAPLRGSLGVVIRQYKSSVTRQILRDFGGPTSLWQRNYYEHILRDEAEWDRTRLYIEANPMNWPDDEENPASRA